METKFVCTTCGNERPNPTHPDNLVCRVCGATATSKLSIVEVVDAPRWGRVFETEVRSDDFDIALDAAEVLVARIDPMRSPSIISKTRDSVSGEWRIIVRSYSLD
mgnify:CR=1 FL=1